MMTTVWPISMVNENVVPGVAFEPKEMGEETYDHLDERVKELTDARGTMQRSFFHRSMRTVKVVNPETGKKESKREATGWTDTRKYTNATGDLQKYIEGPFLDNPPLGDQPGRRAMIIGSIGRVSILSTLASWWGESSRPDWVTGQNWSACSVRMAATATARASRVPSTTITRPDPDFSGAAEHQHRTHPDPVPCRWRNGGPLLVADDTRNALIS